MSVRYAIMGLLREQPDYGYRLKRRFEDRVGRVWRLNSGQVYQTLRTLESNSLIRRIGETNSAQLDDDVAARREFELTERGQRTLKAWLQRKPSTPRPMRDELLIRLLLLEPHGVAEVVRTIDDQEDVYNKHLARLLASKRRVERSPGDAYAVASLGVEAAVLHTVAHLKWLAYCRQFLLEGGGVEKEPGRAPRRKSPRERG